MSETAFEKDVRELAETIDKLRKLPWIGRAREGLDAVEALATEMREAAEEWFGEAQDLQKIIDQYQERNNALLNALAGAIEDRDALLRKLGLSDHAWSSQGGACRASFERALDECGEV